MPRHRASPQRYGRHPDAVPVTSAHPTEARSNSRPPIEIVDVADIPGGGQLHLLKCGKEFSIQFGADELMGSQDHISEVALATLTRERLAQDGGQVLIGGLGMGFTLSAALTSWNADASITVAELVPKVVSWARGPLAHLFGNRLADPRVRLRLEDVHDIIVEGEGRFDAILLDVDNGPDGFITREMTGSILFPASALPMQPFAPADYCRYGHPIRTMRLSQDWKTPASRSTRSYFRHISEAGSAGTIFGLPRKRAALLPDAIISYLARLWGAALESGCGNVV